jgi:hypothetical protein
MTALWGLAMLDWFLVPEGLGPQICSKGHKTCSKCHKTCSKGYKTCLKGMISSPLAIAVFYNILNIRKLIIYAMLEG